MSSSKPRIGLVLSGGAARGAYEAGVISYLRDGLPRETGVHARFDIICGSSVGAINACFLAATADRPKEQGRLLAAKWGSLRIDKVVSFGPMDIARFVRSMVSGGGGRTVGGNREGGIVDPKALEALVIDGCPWDAIPANLDAGHLEALAVSATHVSSGHTVVFVQRQDGTLPPWSHDPFVHASRATIRPQHALASAAIPIMFPPVDIDGHYYCDGGLRQNTPLSPALRLGADRVLVVSLRHVPPEEALRTERVSVAPWVSHETAPSPFFMFGKVINALWLDHVDYDLDRLRRTNLVLEAGARAFGDDFADRLNASMRALDAAPLRAIPELRVQPSRDIGELAAEHVQKPDFADSLRGITGTMIRRMALADDPGEADLVSYLLFDGDFARTLIALGEDDARARRDELARFFDGG